MANGRRGGRGGPRGGGGGGAVAARGGVQKGGQGRGRGGGRNNAPAPRNNGGGRGGGRGASPARGRGGRGRGRGGRGRGEGKPKSAEDLDAELTAYMLKDSAHAQQHLDKDLDDYMNKKGKGEAPAVSCRPIARPRFPSAATCRQLIRVPVHTLLVDE
jgi:hypothetical protein